MSGSPHEHVTVFHSDASDGLWLRTRGMIKFVRSDISIHKVNGEYYDSVIKLLDRFIEFQAFDGIIHEGQQIELASLPAGMMCRHQGEFDDPEFNNVHVETHWPA